MTQDTDAVGPGTLTRVHSITRSVRGSPLATPWRKTGRPVPRPAGADERHGGSGGARREEQAREIRRMGGSVAPQVTAGGGGGRRGLRPRGGGGGGWPRMGKARRSADLAWARASPAWVGGANRQAGDGLRDGGESESRSRRRLPGAPHPRHAASLPSSPTRPKAAAWRARTCGPYSSPRRPKGRGHRVPKGQGSSSPPRTARPVPYASAARALSSLRGGAPPDSLLVPCSNRQRRSSAAPRRTR